MGWNFVPFNFISCYTYDSHTSRHDAIAMLVLCRLGRQIPLDHAIISIAGKNQFSIIMHAMLNVDMQRWSSSRSSAYNAINSKLEPCWISIAQYLLPYRQVANRLPCEHTNWKSCLKTKVFPVRFASLCCFDHKVCALLGSSPMNVLTKSHIFGMYAHCPLPVPMS